MAWAWAQIAAGRACGAAGALVLLRLADRADPEGKCWPGHQRTAVDLNIAESTARAAIQALAKAGLLSVQPREIDGRSTSNLYRLAVDNVPPERGTRVPKSGTESVIKEEPPIKERCARAARTQRGVPPRLSVRGKLVQDEKTGLHHSPGDSRDAQALARILTFPPAQVQQAVARAARLDPEGRAFPSAALRLLLRDAGAKAVPVAARPEWLERRKARAADQGNGDAAATTIEGDAQWTD
ncbi:MAG: hypothetical protein PHO64_12110 [Thiomonas sp.]|nr:hypothetical protein [Thiomonas sp.]